MEIPGSSPEEKEKEKFRPKYMIFLGRHAEKSVKIKEPTVKDEQEWHRKRHGLGAAPKLPKKVGEFNENTLSLKGIYQSHDFGKEFLDKIANEIPEGKIKLKFLNTKAYRTQETAEIIIEEIKAKARKLGKDIQIEGPFIEEKLSEKFDESPDKSLENFNELIADIKKEAQETDEIIVAIGITHEGKLHNYIENKTGKDINQIKPAEFFLVKENSIGKEEIKIIK